MIRVAVTNRQQHVRIGPRRVQAAVRAALKGARACAGRIGVAVMDDAAIRALNRRYLGHDCPTDVISFPLERSGDRLEGEIAVSAETAAAAAERYGWRPDEELLLYVVHGALHLAGLDDRTPAGRAAMRRRERACLAALGVGPPGARGPRPAPRGAGGAQRPGRVGGETQT